MSQRLEVKLWLAHRLTGMALGLFVTIHLITMIVVIQNGLSAGEIMQRTSSNAIIPLFYGVFVFASAVHGSIGLRTVAHEVLRWKGKSLDMVIIGFFLVLCIMGLLAIRVLMS